MHNNYPMQPPMLPEYPMLPEHPPIQPPEITPPPVTVLGRELLLNPSFEDEVPPLNPGQFETTVRPVGWINAPGSAAVEIVQSPYPFPTPPTGSLTSIDGTHWIDSQASPGSIDITQPFIVPPRPEPFFGLFGSHNGKSTLSVSVDAAVENINGQVTSPNDHLLIKFDGKTIEDISTADFTTKGHYGHPGVVNYNQFETFNVQVQASAGVHTIEVQDVGAHQNVGIAVDLVSVKQVLTPPEPVGLLGIIAALLEHHTSL